jgi:hypothetical protein
MTKPLNVLADELEKEIDKIHKMNIDSPEELLIKSCMGQGIKKKYQDMVADSSDQDSVPKYDGKNPRDFGDWTIL